MAGLSPKQEKTVTVYQAGEDFSRPKEHRQPDRVAVGHVQALWFSGEIELHDIEIVRPDGTVRHKQIYRYKPRRFGIRGLSCTAKPSYMHGLAESNSPIAKKIIEMFRFSSPVLTIPSPSL